MTSRVVVKDLCTGGPSLSGVSVWHMVSCGCHTLIFPNGTMNLTLIDSQRIWLNQYGPNFDFDACPNTPSISCKGRKTFTYNIFFGTMAWDSNFGIEIALVKDFMIGWKNK